MKKGFTLVELAIVLVIIGLLIGGILVAQSMAETTKVLKLNKEFEQHIINIRLFKERFHALPGDMPNALAVLGAGNGNGNGEIGYNHGVNAENGCAFNQMYLAGFYQTAYTCNRLWPLVTNPGSDVIKNSSHVTSGQVITYDFGFDSKGYNALVFAAAVQATGGQQAWGSTCCDSNIVAALDSKIDDGNPNTGNINGLSGTCVVAAKYNFSHGDCGILFKFDYLIP